VEFFDRAYEGTPPWEIGHAQPEFVRLEAEGEIRGRVLDVGCGTGENALYYASRGHETWGIDFAPNAIRRAREKAAGRSKPVRFEVASALELSSFGETFETVTDCGIFHTFLDEHRPVYAASVRSALRPRGRFFVLCFSEHEPTDWGGPRRVTQEEIRNTFAVGWKVRWIREARFETIHPEVGGAAWLAALERDSTPPDARPKSTARTRTPVRVRPGQTPRSSPK
jgi:SAM-dependent methyltransferase